MNKIPFLLLFFCVLANGQNIDELYIKQFENDWKVYEDENYTQQYIDTTLVYQLESGRSPEQELLFQAKKNLENRAERIAQIFKDLKLDLVDWDSLGFMEQRSTNLNFEANFVHKGAIITKDTLYGFIYDPVIDNFKVEPYDYFHHSENQNIDQAKQVIGNLIFSGQSNYLDSLAKVENEILTGPLKEVRPQTEFEILIYNKKKKDPLRRIYLHEIFIRIINQK